MACWVLVVDVWTRFTHTFIKSKLKLDYVAVSILVLTFLTRAREKHWLSWSLLWIYGFSCCGVWGLQQFCAFTWVRLTHKTCGAYVPFHGESFKMVVTFIDTQITDFSQQTTYDIIFQTTQCRRTTFNKRRSEQPNNALTHADNHLRTWLNQNDTTVRLESEGTMLRLCTNLQSRTTSISWHGQNHDCKHQRTDGARQSSMLDYCKSTLGRYKSLCDIIICTSYVAIKSITIM